MPLDDKAKRIGILLPSSNSVLEPLAAHSFTESNISYHFSRLGVIEVTLASNSRDQFALDAQFIAGKLLVDVNVDCLVWGGTSASWLGIQHDRDFCEFFMEETGIPTSSCVLEINRLMFSKNVKTYGLITPYKLDVQQKIIENYEALGFSCVGEQHYGGVLSNDYAAIPPEQTENMIRSVAKATPDIILIMCTNMLGATVAPSLEMEIGIPILDSATVTLQAGRRLADLD